MNYLIFDTETTDLLPNSMLPLHKQPSIIEFYGHIISLGHDGWKTIKELEFLCHPGFLIGPKTTKITGIKPEDLEGKPMFLEFADKVAELIGMADAVVAHNLSYDLAVVNVEFKRINKNLTWPPIKICTVEQTEHLKGFRLNLTLLYEHLFGEPFSGAHRAREDVHALTRCFQQLHQMEVV